MAWFWGSRGFKAKAYDIKQHSTHDFMSGWGFNLCLDYCLRARHGGLVVAGPPCSHFVFLSVSWHMRSRTCPEGDVLKPKIIMGNIFVLNFAVLLAILTVRGVLILVEQPESSALWFNYCIELWKQWSRSLRVHTWFRCFKHPMPKPSDLVATWLGAGALKRVWSEKRELCYESMGEYVYTTKCKPSELIIGQGRLPKNHQFTRINRGGSVSGTKHLPESAGYTVMFVEAVFNAWQKQPKVTFDKMDCTYEEAFEACGLTHLESLRKYFTFPELPKVIFSTTQLGQLFAAQKRKAEELDVD